MATNMDWTDISLEDKEGSSNKPEDEIKIEVEVAEEGAEDVVEGDPPNGDVDVDREEKERRETRAQRLKRQRDEARAQNNFLAEKLAALEATVGSLTKTQEEAFRIGQERFKEAQKAQKANLEKEWKEAFDVGDKDKILDIQRQLARLDNDEGEVNLPRREDPPKREAARPVQKVDPKARDWWTKNQWFDPRTPDPVEAAATAYAIKRSQELVDDGFDPSSDEYYAELDKSVSKNFPTLKPSKSNPQRKNPPVTGGNRGSPPAGGNKVRLTPDEVSRAQELGVDLATYARRKREMEMSTDNHGYTVITL